MKILELSSGKGKVGTEEGHSSSHVVAELSNQFVQLGHKVLVADVKSAKKRSALDSKVEVLEVDIPAIGDHSRYQKRVVELVKKMVGPVRARLASDMFDHWRFLRAVTSKVFLNDFDIIHSHHGKQAVILRILYRKSYVFTNHWGWMPSDESLNAKIDRIAIKNAKIAVATGNFLKQFVPEANIQIIPHGINLENWPTLDQKSSRKFLGLTESDFVLLFTGNVAPYKGVDTLIEAVRHLVPNLKCLKLYVVGQFGPYQTQIGFTEFSKNLIDQSKDLPVVFVGFLNNKSQEFLRYLAATDVFVLPSRIEAMGLAALEALAMGKPVVASDVGGLGEMVTEEVGFLIHPGDASALASKIRFLYENPKKLEIMQRNCRKYVETKYSWRNAAQRYIAAFENCINL